MSAIDGLVQANRSYANSFPGPWPGQPGLHLAVVSCMDCRLDLIDGLGLQIGDAHLLRNAGGLLTDDMLRSLAISQRKLGTREIAIIHHTGCGMQGFDDLVFRAELAAQASHVPTWDVPGFHDVQAQARVSLVRARTCRWLPHRDAIRAFVFDVETGRLTEVEAS